jgi:hypothetical protein
LNISQVPDVHDLRKEVDDTAGQREEDNDKDPPCVFVVPNAMDHAYDLHGNGYYQISGHKSKNRGHITKLRKIG